jgi:hypothetical protein
MSDIIIVYEPSMRGILETVAAGFIKTVLGDQVQCTGVPLQDPIPREILSSDRPIFYFGSFWFCRGAPMKPADRVVCFPTDLPKNVPSQNLYQHDSRTRTPLDAAVALVSSEYPVLKTCMENLLNAHRDFVKAYRNKVFKTKDPFADYLFTGIYDSGLPMFETTCSIFCGRLAVKDLVNKGQILHWNHVGIAKERVRRNSKLIKTQDGPMVFTESTELTDLTHSALVEKHPDAAYTVTVCLDLSDSTTGDKLRVSVRTCKPGLPKDAKEIAVSLVGQDVGGSDRAAGGCMDHTLPIFSSK